MDSSSEGNSKYFISNFFLCFGGWVVVYNISKWAGVNLEELHSGGWFLFALASMIISSATSFIYLRLLGPVEKRMAILALIEAFIVNLILFILFINI